MSLTPTSAALFGSIATAIAIFGGGLAVEAYKRRHDRVGMTLALAGAIDALMGLIEARDMTGELVGALEALDAGRPVEFGSLIRDNAPFQAITLHYANQIGGLGGDLPFRVARFLTYSQGLQHDLARLGQQQDKPQVQAMLIRRMNPLWQETRTLGVRLVADLRKASGDRRGAGRRT
ncbi:MAG: hypothetical protein ACRYG6_05025 [Janthinobacterium lividum]